MRRMRLEKKSVNSDRWMVSYADFMTLLLAFFVVMYAVSTVNEGKYRVLSNTLKEAFSNNKSHDHNVPINVNAVKPRLEQLINPVNPIVTTGLNSERHDQSSVQSERAVQDLYNLLGDALPEVLNSSDEWKVTRRNDGLAIELNTDFVFLSGESVVKDSFLPVIERIVSIVGPHAFALQMEGFTDNQPINTDRFPSNWELSGARSAMMVRMFETMGIAPNRLSFVGYGEHYPVASNESETGRALNRRVVIVVRPLSHTIDLTSSSDSRG